MKAGERIPEFDVTLQDGSTLPLTHWSGRWLVLFFYPKDNTPGCTTENIDFSAQAAQFTALNAAVVGVSRDSARSHQNFCTKYSLGHPLIADTDERLCQAFEVIKEKSLYGKRYLGIERSTFLIAPDGHVHAAWRGVKVSGHVDAVLAALRAAQA